MQTREKYSLLFNKKIEENCQLYILKFSRVLQKEDGQEKAIKKIAEENDFLRENIANRLANSI